MLNNGVVSCNFEFQLLWHENVHCDSVVIVTENKIVHLLWHIHFLLMYERKYSLVSLNLLAYEKVWIHSQYNQFDLIDIT